MPSCLRSNRDTVFHSLVAATDLRVGVVEDTCIHITCGGCYDISNRQIVVTVAFHDVIGASDVAQANQRTVYGNEDITLL